jgi:uncharacterized protein YegL
MKSKTYYQLIMDASGSMSGVQVETLNALNSQIESIRKTAAKNPEQKIYVSLTLFDTGVKELITNSAPNCIQLLTRSQYVPNGGTALLDAIGSRIAKLEEVVTSEDDVVMVILTDGEENASQFYNYAQIANKIKTLTDKGNWSFSFLGADIDGWSIAQNLNIRQEEVRSFSKDQMCCSMDDVANTFDNYMFKKTMGFRSNNLFGGDENDNISIPPINK